MYHFWKPSCRTFKYGYLLSTIGWQKQRFLKITTGNDVPGTDPAFFLEGVAALRNGITDWWGKQILKAISKKKASSQGDAQA